MSDKQEKQMTHEEMSERNASMTAHALRKLARHFKLPTEEVQRVWIDASIEYIEVTSGFTREDILADAEEKGLNTELMAKP